jgi:hypothetical protein
MNSLLNLLRGVSVGDSAYIMVFTYAGRAQIHASNGVRIRSLCV